MSDPIPPVEKVGIDASLVLEELIARLAYDAIHFDTLSGLQKGQEALSLIPKIIQMLGTGAQSIKNVPKEAADYDNGEIQQLEIRFNSVMGVDEDAKDQAYIEAAEAVHHAGLAIIQAINACAKIGHLTTPPKTA